VQIDHASADHRSEDRSEPNIWGPVFVIVEPLSPAQTGKAVGQGTHPGAFVLWPGYAADLFLWY